MKRISMILRVSLLVTLALVFSWMPEAAMSATTTFTGNGLWTNDTLWSAGVPQDGDDAVVAGNPTTDVSTAVLSSYTLNAGCTNTISGTNTFLRATNVIINGTMTHLTNSATSTNELGQWAPDNILQIAAYSNVTLNAGGTINANGKGYQGSTNTSGYGPGAGTRGSSFGGGGGYGGRGGYPGGGTGIGGPTYGSTNAPVDPGSAGGGAPGFKGGAGGGLVRIYAAGRITVDGTITANGGNGTDGNWCGAGSGGGVYLACDTFTGNGVISVQGGNAVNWGGGGGGGRIAVVYTNPAAQAGLSPAVQFTAKPVYKPAADTGRDGANGTLYLPDAGFFPYATIMGGWQLCMPPGFTNWSLNALTITNGIVQLADGFRLTVTNGLVLTNQGGLYLSNSAALNCGWFTLATNATDKNPSVSFGENSSLSTTGNLVVAWGKMTFSTVSSTASVFRVGDLVVTNTGKLYFYSGPTNESSPSLCGLLVGVTRDIHVATGATIYATSNPTNGGSALIMARKLTVDPGGTIDAAGQGYSGGGTAAGYGPGGGLYKAGGGGYGGQGGNGSTGAGGGTYGSSNAPVDPGSGGAMGNGGGGMGGGLLRLQVAEQATINGTISANGGNGVDSYWVGGGGSGGGVSISCKRLYGAGIIWAKGGNASGSQVGAAGGGGGGRIAIWRMYDYWSGTPFDTNLVSGGAAVNGGGSGVPGTVFLGQIPPSGTVFTFH